ncbi:MAG: glycerol kinase [Nevskiaceae bacterium]|nr:MAG: glycerol kinase [Nevskiaceae bacterium]TBR71321.1 MAG: glycerol kinase [Nevskiaceae bacterium]
MTVLLALDQGTTSSRAIIFDTAGRPVAQTSRELPQIYPPAEDGDAGAARVEHDAMRIWNDTLACARQTLADAHASTADVAGIGITNQRETTVIWDRATGVPIANAIVWQDRRTAAWCRKTHTPEVEQLLQQRTGLLLDPYFSATKIAWLLDHVSGARRRAERGELAFGTIDCWLVWQLTGGRVHATDATNACRTALFNLHTQQWDDDLLALFDIPRALLPEVRDSAADFGVTRRELFGAEIPIRAVLGDQQAATVGQACFTPGMIKSTYGTGCFVVLNTGDEAVLSKHRLLTTVAWRLAGRPTYALEGSIFVAGAAVQWLRDALHLIHHAGATEVLARSVPDTQGVYLVPAFTGLGAPYWDPLARGAILGLTRDTGVAHIVRAALESVCYQTRDLLDTMAADARPATELRVDGGMVVNDWLVQHLADILRIPVERPQIVETTALGAAYFAGLQAGVFSGLDEIAKLWALQQRFTPQMPETRATTLVHGWRDAVQRVRTTGDATIRG